MPIYEYQCPKCGEFEITQSISDDPLHRCPRCRRKVTKLISATAFHLKGGGWYSDSYDKGGKKKKAAASGGSDATPAAAASTSTSSSND